MRKVPSARVYPPATSAESVALRTATAAEGIGWPLAACTTVPLMRPAACGAPAGGPPCGRAPGGADPGPPPGGGAWGVVLTPAQASASRIVLLMVGGGLVMTGSGG